MPLFVFIFAGCMLGTIQGGKVVFEQKFKEDVPSESDVVPGGNSLPCPGGTICPGTSACCRTNYGSYTCCSWPNDVCCDGGQHCCPRLTICDARSFACIPGSNSPPWSKPVQSKPSLPAPIQEAEEADTRDVMEKKKTVEDAPKSSNLLCPNGYTTCYGTAACCKTYSGSYVCCGYPNDVCCSDGASCCPRGTICDVRNHQCLPGSGGGSKPVPAIPSF